MKLFEALDFQPHTILDSHFQALMNGCSVIFGPFVNGFEVMDPDGNIVSGLDEAEVEDILNEFENRGQGVRH